MFSIGPAAAGQRDVQLLVGSSSNAIYMLNKRSIELDVGPISTSEWSHIVGTYDTTNVCLYVNGILRTNKPYSSAVTNNDIVWVGRGYGENYFYRGNLSDVQLWNRTLSSNEVYSAYTNRTRLAGSEPGLIRYYKLDELPRDGTTLERACPNIQYAYELATNYDTILMAPGVYTTGGITNSGKNGITYQGGYGTLWDADRTIVRRTNSGGYAVHISASTNITVRGLTFTGVVGVVPVMASAANNANIVFESVIVRGNDSGTYAVDLVYDGASRMRNSIVAGNAGGASAVHWGHYYNCIIENNSGKDISVATYANCILGGVQPSSSVDLGGNIWTNITNSVVAHLGIAPGSPGLSNSMVWAGVGAYIPRLGSLAQSAGVGYSGIAAQRSGTGGPRVLSTNFFDTTNVVDSTANGNHGPITTRVSRVVSSPFPYGSSLGFFGAIRGAILVPSNQSLNVSSQITVSAWIRPGGRSGGILSRTEYVSSQGQFNFYNPYADGTSIWFRLNNSAIEMTAPLPGVGVWSHIAGTYDGTNAALYVNGVCVSNRAYATPALTNRGYFVLGGYFDNSAASCYVGELSDVQLWDRPLSSNEVYSSFASRRRLEGNEPGLIGYWKLESLTRVDVGPFNLSDMTIHPTFMEAF